MVNPPSSSQEGNLVPPSASDDVARKAPADPMELILKIQKMIEDFVGEEKKEMESIKSTIKMLTDEVNSIKKATLNLVESPNKRDDLSGEEPKMEGGEKVKVEYSKTAPTPTSVSTSGAPQNVKSTTVEVRKRAVVVNNSGGGAETEIKKALTGTLTFDELVRLERRHLSGV